MKGKRILVVEDSPSVAEMIRDGLTDAGFAAFVAANGFEALRDLEKIEPHLVITDIMMPKVDGLEFAEAIKNRLETRAIPFIILSSHSDSATVERGRKAGARYFMAKPFEVDTLVEAVRKALDET